MSQTNNGGPAFPSTDAKGFVSDGMSLRDYFAGQALAGMIACANTGGGGKYFAEYAYKYADAMLAERKKQKGGEA